MAKNQCQCPHGLMPHCYNESLLLHIRVATGVNALTGLCLIATEFTPISLEDLNTLCQCPHGLMPHCYDVYNECAAGENNGVNALTGLCLIATVPLQKSRFYAVSRACFCRYLSEYSDSSSFSCMFTIWTYFMRQIIPLTLI